MKQPPLTFCSATSCYNIDCERHSFNLVQRSASVLFQDFSVGCSEYKTHSDSIALDSIDVKAVNSITN